MTRADKLLTEGGFARNYEQALGMITSLRYDAWREIDSEHSLRFYAEQLQKLGQLKSDPDTVVAQGSDWRFLNELKRELKA